MRIFKGSNNSTTIKEVISMLKELPGNYVISIAGMPEYMILIDDKKKHILIDDPDYIKELVENSR